MGRKKGRFGWSLGLDEATIRSDLEKSLQDSRKEVGYLGQKHLASYAVLLTQLLGACRISEARDALWQWTQDGMMEQNVRVRKKGSVRRCETCKKEFSKRAKKGNSIDDHFDVSGHPREYTELLRQESRLVLIPSQVSEEDLVPIKEAMEKGVTTNSLTHFSRNKMDINTHALRYSQITNLGKPVTAGGLGRSPQMIAKRTHQTLQFIVDYLDQKASDDDYREQVKVTEKGRGPDLETGT